MTKGTEEHLEIYARESKEFIEQVNRIPIEQVLELKLAKNGHNKYVCPICNSGGSGRSDSDSALNIDKNSNRIKCYSHDCFGNGEDCFGAYKIVHGLTTQEALERLGFIPSYKQGAEASAVKLKTTYTEERIPQKATPKEYEDYTENYALWHTALMEGDNEGKRYLRSRGISEKAMEYYNIGYCSEWRHPKSPQTVPTSKRIIIPRTKRTYLARAIDGSVKDYAKQITGTNDMFNIDTILYRQEDTRPIVVVEGELDCISLTQQGFRSVGICSISNVGAFVKEAKEKNSLGYYIIALDNDTKNSAGQKASEQLYKELKAEGIKCMMADSTKLYGECKDANGRIQTEEGRQELTRIMNEYITEAMEDNKSEGIKQIDSFIEKISKGQALVSKIPTGISSIDYALGGGFCKESLVILGASTSAGKTILATQIGESMARRGESVLYYNFEMSSNLLIARALVRLSYGAMSTDDILDGKADLNTFEKMANIYRNEIAPNFIYKDNVLPDVDEVTADMTGEATKLSLQGKRAPIVVIDYLHLLTAYEEVGNCKRALDQVQSIKKAVEKFNRWAIENNSIVLCISANNRASNKTGEATIDSGRDTSTLEYTADYHIGLEYYSRGKSLRDLKITEDDSLAVIKNELNITDETTLTPDMLNCIQGMFKQGKIGEVIYSQIVGERVLRINKDRKSGTGGNYAKIMFKPNQLMFMPIEDQKAIKPTRKTI